MCKRKPNLCIFYLFFITSYLAFHVGVFKVMFFSQTEPLLLCVRMLSLNLQLLLFDSQSGGVCLAVSSIVFIPPEEPPHSLFLSYVFSLSLPCVLVFLLLISVCYSFLMLICTCLAGNDLQPALVSPPCFSFSRADGKCCISPFPPPSAPFLSCFLFLYSSVKSA